MAANRRRGEISAIIDGQQHTLCLTLGALAELESSFSVNDLTALSERFSTGRFSSNDLICIVGAALRGAGTEINNADVKLMRADGGVAGFAAIVADLLTVTFGNAREEVGHNHP